MSLIYKPNPYHNSLQKHLFDYFGAAAGIILTFPLFVIISIEILRRNGRPVFFRQKRVGKNGRIFNLYKFRTMNPDAEKQKSKISYLNEADGPVFKIKDDPRYTEFGKALAKTGLDELPQLINVLTGDMSLIGPRPLPSNEADKLPEKDKIRHKINPGITSDWVITGAHKLKFNQWMKLDRDYVAKASLSKDLRVLIQTGSMVMRQIDEIIKFF